MELWITVLVLAVVLLALGPSSGRRRKRREENSDEVAAHAPPVKEAGAEAATLLAKLDESLTGTLHSVHCIHIGRWCVEQASVKQSAAHLHQTRGNWRGAISEAWMGLLHLQSARAIKAEYVRLRAALSGEPAPADSDVAAPQEDYCDVGNARLTTINRDWIRVGELVARARAMVDCVGERFPEFADVHMDLRRAQDYFEQSRLAKSVTDAQELVCAGAFFARLAIEAAESYLDDHQKAVAFVQSVADIPVAVPPNALSAEARKFMQFACPSVLLAGQMSERQKEKSTVSMFHFQLALRHIATAKMKYLDRKFGASRYEAAQGWFHANLSREAIDTYITESALLAAGQPGTIADRGGDKMSEYALTGYRYRNKGQVQWRRLALTIVKLEALLNVRYPSFDEKEGVLDTAHSYETKADVTEQWADVGAIVDRGLRFIDAAVKRIESGEDGRTLAR